MTGYCFQGWQYFSGKEFSVREECKGLSPVIAFMHCVNNDFIAKSGTLMKRLFIVLLLFIFSVQGAIAAIGDRTLLQGHEVTTALCANTPDVECRSIDTEEPDVFPVVEELSDYVIIGLAAPHARHMAIVVHSLPVHLLSTDLPTKKPPPRS